MLSPPGFAGACATSSTKWNDFTFAVAAAVFATSAGTDGVFAATATAAGTSASRATRTPSRRIPASCRIPPLAASAFCSTVPRATTKERTMAQLTDDQARLFKDSNFAHLATIRGDGTVQVT